MEGEEHTDEEGKQKQEIWSWGAGTEGQLGTTMLEDDRFPQLLHFPPLSFSSPLSLLSCGGAHAIALTFGGKVLTWGRGSSGQLGHGDLERSLFPKPVIALESFFITHVSAGWNHSGFVSVKGNLYTCGDGSFGQLGHGDYRSLCSPVKVDFFACNRVHEIACGMRHSLALLKGCSEGQVYGFGSGKRGQLGISKATKSINIPTITCGLEDVDIVSIAANGDHSAALSAHGHLYTWGRGFGRNSDSHSAKPLPSVSSFTEVALGWNHALALTDNGDVYMLGGNRHGVLSDSETSNVSKYLPAGSNESALDRVPGLDKTKVVCIAAGSEHSAIVTDEGVVKTWGWGEHGQLGLGDTCDRTSPQAVVLGSECNNPWKKDGGIFSVYCGSGFTFALRTPSSS